MKDAKGRYLILDLANRGKELTVEFIHGDICVGLSCIRIWQPFSILYRIRQHDLHPVFCEQEL